LIGNGDGGEALGGDQDLFASFSRSLQLQLR